MYVIVFTGSIQHTRIWPHWRWLSPNLLQHQLWISWHFLASFHLRRYFWYILCKWRYYVNEMAEIFTASLFAMYLCGVFLYKYMYIWAINYV